MNKQKKYIEVSLKSAPQFCVNFLSVSKISADEISLVDFQRIIQDKQFIRGEVEVLSKTFDQILAVDDIARVTIVDRPVLEAPEKE